MKKSTIRLTLSLACLFSIIPTATTNVKDVNTADREMVSLQHLGEEDTDFLFNSLINEQKPLAQNDYYANYYFMNLRNNIGNNVYGSCTYVAIGMLLSFYDSYWDDSFISENYDVASQVNTTTPSDADFDLIPLNSESPGIAFETNDLVGGVSLSEYLEVVNQNSNSYFQFKLIQLGKQLFGSEKFDTLSQPLGMNYSELQNFLNYYLYTFNQKSNNNVSINSNSGSSSSVKSFTISKLLNGIPVLLRAKSSNDDTGHAMIAYDYNSKTHEIYVHTGWRDEANNTTLTHVSLSDLGHDVLCDATTIELNYDYEYSRNYVTSDGTTITSDSYWLPRNIKLVSGNYRDTLPKFTWDGMFKEKWVSDENPFYILSILKANSFQIFEIPNIYKKEYTLTQEQWDYLLFTDTSSSYQIYVEMSSNSYPYWDDYWTKESFSKPKVYDHLPNIFPIEYDFADAYPTDKENAEQYTSHTTSNGFTFQTRKYRTGYIHDEFIVMSSISKGVNEAYIEYRFDTAVTRIDVELSHWRAYSNEWLSSSTGMAELQYYSVNEWKQKLDLLSSSTNLPTNRSQPKTYKVMFEVPVYRIRFYSKSFGINTNDSNRGRICIGNIGFYPSNYSLSVSGSELDYNPQVWTYVSNKTNCYSYAVNSQINPTYNNLQTMQPGQSFNYSLTEDDLLNPSRLISILEKDAKNLGYGFYPVEKNARCSLGMYKVALVIDNQYKVGDSYKYDYHWYRQNSDGTWSHKPGTTPVTKYDNSNNIIMDPAECNRDNGLGLNYNYFVGYYSIIPLNNYYN